MLETGMLETGMLDTGMLDTGMLDTGMLSTGTFVLDTTRLTRAPLRGRRQGPDDADAMEARGVA